MKIAVCIKRTPDSESRFKISGSGSSIEEAGLKFDMDDFASYAVEVALQLNEKQGRGPRHPPQDGRCSVRRSRGRQGTRCGAQERRIRPDLVRQVCLRYLRER